MIYLKILVVKNGKTFEENRVLEDKDDFKNEYDCEVIRSLVEEISNETERF